MSTNDQVEDEWVRTDDGAHLRMRRYGDSANPTILLSHGWACRLEYWDPQIERLSTRFQVIVYDHRGHGKSTRGRRRIDSDVLADDLAHIVDRAVSTTHAVVVGHSMGGIAIQAWWGRHSTQARQTTTAAVLANTASGGLRHGSRVVPLLDGKSRIPELLSRRAFQNSIRLPDSAIVREIVRWRVMNRRRATRAQAAFLTHIVSTCDPRVRAETALALADVDLGAEAAKAIEVPVSVLVGRVDRVTPPWMGRQIADVLSRGGRLERFVELDTGHAGNIEAAAQVNREIEYIADRYARLA